MEGANGTAKILVNGKDDVYCNLRCKYSFIALVDG